MTALDLIAPDRPDEAVIPKMHQGDDQEGAGDPAIVTMVIAREDAIDQREPDEQRQTRRGGMAPALPAGEADQGF